MAEDNSAIQDHIALRPIMITTGGFVSELKYTKAEPKEGKQKLVEKLKPNIDCRALMIASQVITFMCIILF